jgi:hypothetical protein
VYWIKQLDSDVYGPAAVRMDFLRRLTHELILNWTDGFKWFTRRLLENSLQLAKAYSKLDQNVGPATM